MSGAIRPAVPGRRLLPAVALAAATLLAGGCVKQEMADLDSYIAEVKAKKAAPIEPLPEVKTFETFVYEAQELREPFSEAVRELAETEQPSTNGLRPDTSRPREPLESYGLEELTMVAMMTLGDRTWAAIRAPDGTVHRLQVGNYIGRNHGHVMRITETAIDLAEIVPDARGGWQERDNTLKMNLQD